MSAGVGLEPEPRNRVAPLTRERPFPGPYPYREADSLYFRGRRQESDELARLIRRSPLTVLFGASGLGKSSLLSAGLFPVLREQGYLPVLVRLKFFGAERAAHEAELDLVGQVMTDLRDAAVAAKIEAESDARCPTFWEYFRRLELWSESGSPLTPVLILDQFEEVFTLGAQSRSRREAVARLFAALGDLVEDRTPPELVKALRDDKEVRGALSDREPLFRIVLSLREEYLPHLEALRSEIPSLSKNRMRLLPFDGERAACAMVDSAPHLLEPGVAESIVRSVAGKRAGGRAAGAPRISSLPSDPSEQIVHLSVEPSLLNLFCYQLNERRLTTAREAARAPKPRIDASLVHTASADILSDFYEDCLRGLGRDVRRFVEQGLLSSSGYRLPVPERSALAEPGITEGVITTLENRRLVRKETRHDTVYLEIVHDVVAQTIVEARSRRSSQRRARGIIALLASAVGVALVIIAFFVNQVRTKGEQGLKELSPQLAWADRQLKENREKVGAVQKQVGAVQKELEVRRADVELATLQLMESNKELARAQQETTAAQEEARSALAEREAAERSVKELRVEVGQLRAEASRASAEARAVRASAEKTRIEAERMRAEMEALGKKHAALKRELEALERQRGVPGNLE